jgi:hypothetical protein
MAKPRARTQADLARMFNRMVDQLEANLAACKAVEAQKTKQAAEKGASGLRRQHARLVAEASV